MKICNEAVAPGHCCSTHIESFRASWPFCRAAFSLMERSLFSLPTERTCVKGEKDRDKRQGIPGDT